MQLNISAALFTMLSTATSILLTASSVNDPIVTVDYFLKHPYALSYISFHLIFFRRKDPRFY